jgi:hypothetical protein
MILYNEHNPEHANKIWRAYKPTLAEKHGEMGARGDLGEQQAARFYDLSGKYKAVIVEQNCDKQLLGIDLTVISGKGEGKFVQVKKGGSALYYDKISSDWYITIRKNWWPTMATEFMCIGPKGDIFATISTEDAKDILALAGSPEVFKFYRRSWYKAPSIQSNLT